MARWIVARLAIVLASACVPQARDAEWAPDAVLAAIERGADAEPAHADVAIEDDAGSVEDAAPLAEDATPSDDAMARADDATTMRDASPRDAAPRDAAAPDATLGACDPTAHPTPHAGAFEGPGAGGCPNGMVPAGNACIDQFEAVLFEIAPDGSATAWSPYFNPGNRRVRAASIAGVVPQAYVNGRQAAAACGEAGKRLCTDAEWLRACRGASNQAYPYGPARIPGACNDARARHPAVEHFGTSDAWIWSELDHPCIDQLPNSLAATGAYAGCVTAEGVHDLMGNLHEWTADPAGTFRGGYYVDTVRNGNGCAYATTAHDLGHWDYSTGFRCCADLP